ncbi:response regulator [Candidatus Magnetomonas plexicatena]|nr:response regulator [Nitrospirales bacterium LBB_01]
MEKCPAVLKNAERICWLVAGTFSGNENKAACLNTLTNCKECEFYLLRQHTGYKDAENIRILVVEDERIIAREIEERLKRMGFSVIGIVSSGESALQKIPEELPDLVLMDIRLRGDIDGIEAAKHIRGKYDIPVIFLTAHSDKATLERAKVTQPYGYLLKPFHEKDISATIEMSLFKHKMDVKNRDEKQQLSQSVQNQEVTVQTADRSLGMLEDMNNKIEKAISIANSDEQKEYLQLLKETSQKLRQQIESIKNGSKPLYNQ